ncbi:short transient receptor potential channel 4-like [Ptychodera flava]|uniref:short transient receptor potential channel 4-like n=1 Tax=Ptychodera flava TaxID=63121 RepID=UPI003969E3A4
MAESKEELEQMYLISAEKGDLQVLETTLIRESEFDVNVRDSKGRSALELAIEKGLIDVVRMLLKHPIDIGDSLLLAIENKFFKAAQAIVENSQGENVIDAHPVYNTEDYHPDTTPIILAAHRNDYDTIKLLMLKGAPPIDLSTIQSEKHTVQRSVGTLNIYRALASEAYLSYIEIEKKENSDPFGRAFELSVELRELSSLEYEFRQDYTELAERCAQFAADLLGQTRDASELSTVLNHSSRENGCGGQSMGLPSKVYDAVKGVQKQFVAHPYCQQELIERWYRGLTDWRDKSSIRNILLSTLIMLVSPFLSLIYIIYPFGKFGDFMRIPYVKFLTHTASYLYFVLVLILSTLDLGSYNAESELGRLEEKQMRNQLRGSEPYILEWILIIWVVGMVWAEIKALWQSSFREYFSDTWHWFNVVQLGLYVSWICLRIVAYIMVREERNSQQHQPDASTTGPIDVGGMQTTSVSDYVSIGATTSVFQTTRSVDNITAEVANNVSELIATVLPTVSPSSTAGTATQAADIVVGEPTARSHGFDSSAYSGYAYSIPRSEWSSSDPTLIADCVVALANVVSIVKFLRIMVINDYVGPLQISVSKMMNDIIQFMFVFIVIWFAFALGLTQIYWLYSASDKVDCLREGGSSHSCGRQPFADIGSALGSLFWSLYGLVDLETLFVSAEHESTELFGTILYGGYNVIAIIILLNLLIALMGTTYTNVSEHADVEWKFSRSELWMDYFKHGTTLAPPFNLIPTPKSLVRLAQYLINNLCCRTCDKKVNWVKSHKETVVNVNYKEVCKQLVQRYFSEKASEARDSGDGNAVKEDLVAIKQDLSSLRYDIYGIRQRVQKVSEDFNQKSDIINDGVQGARSDIERNKLQDNEVLKESRIEILGSTEQGNTLLTILEEGLSRFKSELKERHESRNEMLFDRFKSLHSDFQQGREESTEVMREVQGQIDGNIKKSKRRLTSVDERLATIQTRLEEQENISRVVADSVKELAKSIDQMTSQIVPPRQRSGRRVTDIIQRIESNQSLGDDTPAEDDDPVFSL